MGWETGQRRSGPWGSSFKEVSGNGHVTFLFTHLWPERHHNSSRHVPSEDGGGQVGAEALNLPMPRPPPIEARTSQGPKRKPRETAKLLDVGQILWCLPGLPSPLI